MGDSKIAERRLKKRHAFSATAEITELTSGARLASRAADLSMQGCYLDSLNPFAVGTRIRVRIMWEGSELICAAVVRDSQPGLGMGVSFANLDDARRAVLQGWVNRLDSGGRVEANVQSAVTDGMAEPDGEMNEALALRLVELLGKKGLLDASEVSSLLRNKA